MGQEIKEDQITLFVLSNFGEVEAGDLIGSSSYFELAYLTKTLSKLLAFGFFLFVYSNLLRSFNSD